MRVKKSDYGTQLWLSAKDTYNWAHKSGASWPCSVLSGHRLYAQFDKGNDLIDVTIDGKSKDCPGIDINEFNAITSDFMR